MTQIKNRLNTKALKKMILKQEDKDEFMRKEVFVGNKRLFMCKVKIILTNGECSFIFNNHLLWNHLLRTE